MELPTWLQENNVGMCPCGCIGKRSKKNFIEKTLYDLSKVVRGAVFSEEIINKPGLLQVLDPRVKLIGFACLLVSISLVHNFYILLMTYASLIILAFLSLIPMSIFLKRVWLVVPLFTGIMLLPSLFNWIIPGAPLITLWDFKHSLSFGPINLPATLAITKQGIKGGSLMILRVGISVSLALLLTLTTRWPDLLKSLRIFLVPKIFVSTIEMTYRYIFVLLTIVEEMFFARKSRTISNSDLKENRRFIASSMGTLYGKSYTMSEEVYQSMLSRGYTGEIHNSTQFYFTFWDWSAIVLAVLLSLLIYVGDKAAGGILI